MNDASRARERQATSGAARRWMGGDTLALLLISVLLGAAARIVSLDEHSIWIDEAATLIIGTRSFSDLWFKPYDPTPPLYYMLHKAFVGITDSPARLRSISAAVGILAIPAIYCLGRSLGGKKLGLAAALFLAGNAVHVRFSQEARAYALLFLLIVIATIGISEYLRRAKSGRNHGHWLALYIASGLLAIYVHYAAIIWLCSSQSILLLDALTDERRRIKVRAWAIASGFLLIGVVPALFLMQNGYRSFDWLPQASFSDFTIVMSILFLVWPPLLLFHPLISGAAMAVAGVTFLAGLRIVVRQRGALVVFLIFALYPMLLWAVGVVKPVFMFRTAFPAIVAPILCWSMLATTLRPPARIVAIGLLAAVMIASIFTLHRLSMAREDWQGAAAFLISNTDDNDLVVHCFPDTYSAIRFYLPDDSLLSNLGIVSEDRAELFPAPALEAGPWPEVISNLAGGSDPPPDRLVGPAEIHDRREPGSSIWIVDAYCWREQRQNMQNFLAGFEGSAQEVWKSEYDIITIFELTPDRSHT